MATKTECTCGAKMMQGQFHLIGCPIRIKANEYAPKVPPSSPRSGHYDPFQGICIHGVQGARFSGGVLINPDCSLCPS